jgi:TonB family protein
MKMRNLWIGLFALLFTSPLAAQDLVYRVSDQVTAPKALTTAKPPYTPAAMLKRIEGFVELEVDVMPDGTVGAVALVKSLDPALDQEAAKTAKKFTFTPGMKDGKPVAVRTTVKLEYNMR